VWLLQISFIFVAGSTVVQAKDAKYSVFEMQG